MFGRPSLLFVIWVIVGIVVASSRGYLTDLDDISRLLSAILAVLAWPLVLLNISVAI